MLNKSNKTLNNIICKRFNQFPTAMFQLITYLKTFLVSRLKAPLADLQKFLPYSAI